MAKPIQFHFGRQTYRFTLRIGFFLLCLLFFILFCILGSWQLERYQYKKNLFMTYDLRLKAPPVAFSSINHNLRDLQHSSIIHIENKNLPLGSANESMEKLQFQSVSVSGFYVNSLTVLLQNKQYKNKLGYEVITPLKIPGEKKLLLVDRGWVPEFKQHFPMIEHVKGEQQLTGYLKLLNEHQFILGDNLLQTFSIPLIMQKIDVKELTELTHQNFYPFILRLNANETHGFIRDWVVSSSLPERHLGYAVQWFAMAFVLFIAYLCFCIERVKHEAK